MSASVAVARNWHLPEANDDATRWLAKPISPPLGPLATIVLFVVNASLDREKQMLKTIGATFLSMIITASAVVFIVSSLSKPVLTQAATVSPVAVSEPSAFDTLTYNGRHSDWVRKLLTRAGTWKCPANASDTGTPPSVKVDACMRDKYVAAAVLYAWATECYARQNEDTKAAEAADQMYENLKSAEGLCSDAPSVGGGSCETEKIFGCDEAL